MRETAQKKHTPRKKRSPACYQRKVDKMTKWYYRMLKFREKPIAINPHTKIEAKRKPLKSLEEYIATIKPPFGEK